MKKITILLGILFVCIAVVFTACSQRADQKVKMPPSLETASTQTSPDPSITSTDSTTLTIQYAEYRGFPVELYSEFNKISIRIVLSERYNPEIMDSKEALDFLKTEVERLTTGDVVPLGKSGYAFQMTSGRPIWGPYTTLSQQGDYKCIQFAEKGRLDGTVLYAIGRTDPVGEHEFYPYYKKTS
jgi:hypothetical protein